MTQIFIDSSAWSAVADPAHRHHREAAEYFVGLIQRGCELVTSSDVLTETYAWFLQMTGPGSAAEFRSAMKLARRQGLVRIVPVDAEVARKAWELFERYHDRLSSSRHCTSFVIAGRLGIRDVFSFHDDFNAIGFRVWPQAGANGDELDLTT
jgi:predicted nucleic acid-binding protein